MPYFNDMDKDDKYDKANKDNKDNNNDEFSDIYFKLERNLRKMVLAQTGDAEEYFIIYTIRDENFTQELIKELILKDDCNLVLFSIDKYIENILDSYKYHEGRILAQFKADFPRNSFFFNHKRFLDEKLLMEKFNDLSNYSINLDEIKLKFSLLLLLLCNQSSLAFPYLLIYKLYAEKDPTLMIQSLPTNRNVEFIIENNIIDITLNLDLGIKKIDENKVLKKIHLKLYMQFYQNEQINEMDILSPKYGVLEWFIC